MLPEALVMDDDCWAHSPRIREAPLGRWSFFIENTKTHTTVINYCIYHLFITQFTQLLDLIVIVLHADNLEDWKQSEI